MHNPILSIFEALAVSGFPNKEDLRIEVLGCIKSFISYFDDVVNEQIYYSATAKDKQDICIMKAHDERRRKAHDLCIGRTKQMQVSTLQDLHPVSTREIARCYIRMQYIVHMFILRHSDSMNI